MALTWCISSLMRGFAHKHPTSFHKRDEMELDGTGMNSRFCEIIMGASPAPCAVTYAEATSLHLRSHLPSIRIQIKRMRSTCSQCQAPSAFSLVTSPWGQCQESPQAGGDFNRFGYGGSWDFNPEPGTLRHQALVHPLLRSSVSPAPPKSIPVSKMVLTKVRRKLQKLTVDK